MSEPSTSKNENTTSRRSWMDVLFGPFASHFLFIRQATASKRISRLVFKRLLCSDFYKKLKKCLQIQTSFHLVKMTMKVAKPFL